MKHVVMSPDVAVYRAEPAFARRAEPHDPPPLSPRAKVGIWIGLSALLWSPIIAAVALLT